MAIPDEDDRIEALETAAWRRGQDDALEQVALELDSIRHRLPEQATEARVTMQYVQDALESVRALLITEREVHDSLMREVRRG